MSYLKRGDSVGLIACSDGRHLSSKPILELLEQKLESMGLVVVYANTIYSSEKTPFSGTPEQRATELMRFFEDSSIRAIFDISGGNAANQVLSHLNFEVMQRNPKPFVGLSDLSVLLNAIYHLTGIPTFHYQLTNLIGQESIFQFNLFHQLFLKEVAEVNAFQTFPYTWVRGSRMEGTIIGGNTRCFLKLAGTKYMPDPANKIVFLESLGGGPTALASMFAQLDQLAFFEKCEGILLGTFTSMEKEKATPSICELIVELTKKYDVPIAKTDRLGHGSNAHCLPIGMSLSF